MSEKLTRKEMREPDPFVRMTSQYWAKLIEHKKTVSLALLGLLALFLAAAIVSSLSARKEAAAGAALSKALETARRGVEGSFDPATDADAPKFKTAKEKDEELAKQFAAVRSEFGGTDAATSATLYLGDAQYHLGQYEEAAKSYEAFLADTQKGEAARALALEGLGYVHETSKAWDKALEAFGRMADEAAGDPAKARAAFHRARVLEESGKKQEAAAAFDKLKQDFKETPAAREANERLALLASQGVTPPKAAETAPDAKASEKR